MSLALFTPVIGKLIDKVGDLFPSEAEKNAAKVLLLQAEQNGELEVMRVQMSAILAEASAADPWTSRARPSFLYVIYILILMAVPMGFLSAHNPDTATAVAAGFGAWLRAIPESLYALFGVGYVGYAASRSYDKAKSGVK